MGGFFGAVCNRDVVSDVFFGTDYHSHLGTKSAGMCFLGADGHFQREIHSIVDTPFRSRFAKELDDFKGNAGIASINDTDPQPLVVRSKFGLFAITTLGAINNREDLTEQYLAREGRQFMAMGSGLVNATELVAALIDEQESLAQGIRYAQSLIDGSLTVCILTVSGELIVARDSFGRLPVFVGKSEDGYCVAFENFTYRKLGYDDCYELGPAEIVKLTADSFEVLAPAGTDMKICAFLWSYYGYPNSSYEGQNVETMRYRNGEGMAAQEMAEGGIPDVDYVAGVPESGVPHAIGFANASGKPYARPFVKYTPTWVRSFTPTSQDMRNQVAKMKQVPVRELIEGKKLLFVDDSIVRGTQLRETVDFLYESGAAQVHMRSACPPIMYNCKYLNFSRNNSEMDLLARRVVQELEGDEGQAHLDEYADGKTERGKCLLSAICKEMGFDSLGYQSLDGVLKAIGLDPSKVCTYCWTGKE